jgi:ligand-binding sensor domain-containing protein
MNRNKIIIGSVTLLAVVTMFAVSPWMESKKVGSYKKQDLSSVQKQSADDAQAWLRARYIDQSTGLPITAEKLEQIRKEIAKSPRSKNISFMEQGPDNIGGRTRAIQIDRTNNNRLWAGGVSGGLFVSSNRANNWSRVTSYIDAGASPFISSMTQTPNGVFYVATGSNQESWNGNGVWYSEDFGNTWTKIPGTTNCTEIVSSDVDNYVWLATSTGLKKWQPGDVSLTSITVTNGSCNTVQISKDGQVLVGAFASNKTYVSNDGGQNWADKSGSGAGLVPTGAPRMEYAISADRVNGSYSLYAARTNSNLSGMNVSHDNGNTWFQFVGASGTPSNLDIYRNQGTYNSIISVDPSDNERLLIGGIDVWQWKQTVNNPPSGGFEKLSQWFVPPFSTIYAHADQHEMKWDAVDRLYIGNDGGVGVSDDYGTNWYPANRGYNVTQFYGIAFDRDGSVMGGTQDNGTLYNDHTLSTFQEFREVNGGDGFECEISFFNPRVMFSSIYYNTISRSGDAGSTWSSFVPTLPGTYDPAGTEGNFHPFHTEFVMAEYYDLNSQDSVVFIPTRNYAVGDVVKVPSMATGDTMTFTATDALYFDDTLEYDPTLTINDVSVVNSLNNQTVFLGNYTWTPFASASGTNPPTIGDSLLVNFPTGADTVVVGSIGTYEHFYALNPSTGESYSLGNDTVAFNISWDTLVVQDPYQSWFLMYVNANGGELWGTRNALRLAAPNPNWVIVAKGIGGGIFNSVDIEFSRDLNRCYVSSGNGVWRIDNLGDVYSSDPDFETKAGYHGTGLNTVPTATDRTKITNTNYEGIALNPNNSNDLVCFAGFGGTNKRSLNAGLSATPTFTTLPSIPGSPASYDGIIDRDDADILVVGTSEGVWVTEDGGGLWENASTGFDGTPVYEVRQSWRTWDEGNARPGEIYIGTFGRGIWSTAAYLGIGENTATDGSNFKTKLKTYPNPTTENTTLSFNLKENSNVSVYVYSITGRLVKTISEKNVAAGSQLLTIDSNDLPDGTYIVKLIAGKQNDTVKFIKM